MRQRTWEKYELVNCNSAFHIIPTIIQCLSKRILIIFIPCQILLFWVSFVTARMMCTVLSNGQTYYNPYITSFSFSCWVIQIKSRLPRCHQTLGINKFCLGKVFYCNTTYIEMKIHLQAVRLVNYHLELKHSLPNMFSPLVDDNTFWTSVIVIFVPFNATVRETCKYFVCVWKVVHGDKNKEITHLIK